MTAATSRAAAAVLAAIKMMNSVKMAGRAVLGTGPGIAAISSSTKSAKPSTSGTARTGPRRRRSGMITCGKITTASDSSGQKYVSRRAVVGAVSDDVLTCPLSLSHRRLSSINMRLARGSSSLLKPRPPFQD